MNFFIFYLIFRSIAVSSLIVHLYDSRSSADDFCSKSLCPGSEPLRIRPNLRIFFDFLTFTFVLFKFLMTQPLLNYFIKVKLYISVLLRRATHIPLKFKRKIAYVVKARARCYLGYRIKLGA